MELQKKVNFSFPPNAPVQKQMKHEENLFDSEEFVQEALSTPQFTLKENAVVLTSAGMSW